LWWLWSEDQSKHLTAKNAKDAKERQNQGKTKPRKDMDRTSTPRNVVEIFLGVLRGSRFQPGWLT
jgi:hypothetical protein